MNITREIYLVHTRFAKKAQGIRDLSLRSISAGHELVTMPPTDGSMMSRHLSPHQDGVQSLKGDMAAVFCRMQNAQRPI